MCFLARGWYGRCHRRNGTRRSFNRRRASLSGLFPFSARRARFSVCSLYLARPWCHTYETALLSLSSEQSWTKHLAVDSFADRLSDVTPFAFPTSPRHAAPRRWVRGRTTRDERGHREGEPSPSRASVRPLVGRRTRDERAGPRSRERWWPPTRAGARWRRRRTSRAWSARACGSCAWTPTRRTSCSANTAALRVRAAPRVRGRDRDPSSEPLAARRIDADSDDFSDEEDPERDAEGPLRFLTMVSPTDAPPIEPLIEPPTGPTGPGSGSVTGRSDPSVGASRRNATPALSAAKLHPGGGMCALTRGGRRAGFGVSVRVRARGARRRRDESLALAARVRRVSEACPGVVARVPQRTRASVTWLEWSADDAGWRRRRPRRAMRHGHPPSRPFDGTGTRRLHASWTPPSS